MIDTTRHRELFNPLEFHSPITIIGAGATGSWLALILAKLGINGEQTTVYDFDTVEEHNIANQAYSPMAIGSPKVNALFTTVGEATGAAIKIKNEKYTNQRLSGVVFLMVDSMAERKRIWEESIRMKPSIELLVEPRMGLDVGRVYNVIPTNLEHIKRYEQTYYADDVAEVSACGASKTVITTAMSIAAYCGRQLINHHNRVEMDNEILLDLKFNNIIATRW